MSDQSRITNLWLQRVKAFINQQSADLPAFEYDALDCAIATTLDRALVSLCLEVVEPKPKGRYLSVLSLFESVEEQISSHWLIKELQEAVKTLDHPLSSWFSAILSIDSYKRQPTQFSNNSNDLIQTVQKPDSEYWLESVVEMIQRSRTLNSYE